MLDRMASKMDFSDPIGVDGINIGLGGNAKIGGRNFDIVDVEQQAASALRYKPLGKLDFTHFIATIGKITGGIFDKDIAL